MGPPSNSKKILLVDDDESTLFALRRHLQSLGVPVDVAGTVAEVRVLLRGTRYAAVITDLRLSGSEGEEGLEIVRMTAEQQPQAGRVLITAYGTPDVMAATYRAGAAFILEKPITFADLKLALARLGVVPAGESSEREAKDNRDPR